VSSPAFPWKEGTARLKCITHAKLAPDYRRILTEDAGQISIPTVQIPRPPNLPHEGGFPVKAVPKLGRTSVEKSFFGLLF